MNVEGMGPEPRRHRSGLKTGQPYGYYVRVGALYGVVLGLMGVLSSPRWRDSWIDAVVFFLVSLLSVSFLVSSFFWYRLSRRRH